MNFIYHFWIPCSQINSALIDILKDDQYKDLSLCIAAIANVWSYMYIL